MAKIPFDIKFRPQIESGECKVETRDGLPVRVLCFDAEGRFPVVAMVDSFPASMYTKCGCAMNNEGHGKYDLFIVTPEPELSEFEIALENFVMNADASEQTFHEDVKQHAAELLAIAKEQLDIEVLNDRAVELTKQLNESGLDENSIEYELIEFMCNLMDCPNWSEIVETAGLHADRIKAYALKDIPRWFSNLRHIDPLQIIDWRKGEAFICRKGKIIPLKDLENLPGFKED